MNQAEYTESAAVQAIKTLMWSETVDLPKNSHEMIASFVPDDLRHQEGQCLDQFYDEGDLKAETHERIRLDLGAFVRDNWADLQGIEPEQAGHDFILSRNETGAGFGSHRTKTDEERDAGERLRVAAQRFTPIGLY